MIAGRSDELRLAPSVHDVSVGGRGRIPRVQKVMGVPDHLAEEGGERAELDRLPFSGQMDAAVDERSHERQIGFAAFADQLGWPVWEIGHFELRGFAKLHRLFELPPDE